MVRSEMKRSGLFLQVLGHEPQSTPGKGLTCAVFFKSTQPVELVLNAASSIYLLQMRVYTDQLQAPVDKIEDIVVEAVDKIIDFLSENFDLSGVIRNIDFMGQYGFPVKAEGGYIAVKGNTDLRIVDIDIPCLVNDTISFTG